MIGRLPVFIGGIFLGFGLTYLGGWPFRCLIAAAWIGLLVEISMAASQSLGLSQRKYLWLDMIFFGLLPLVFVATGRFLFLAAAILSWIFVFFLFFPTNRTGLSRWLFSVVVHPYIAMGVFSFFSLRGYGWGWPACALMIVAAADTGAYLIGKQFGKHLLAPSISPAKTIEGSVGGVILAGGLCALFLTYRHHIPAQPAMAISMGLAVLAVLGDLFESFLKRGLDLKDFGSSLPGHGGLFDRLDSIMPVSIGLLVLLKLA